MKYYIQRHKLNPFIKKGIILCITPSFICNYNCKYCYVTVNGRKPSDGTLKTGIEWIEFIENFPLKVAEVIITGGEPSLYRDFVYLVTELLKRKYFVCVYTNLSKPNTLLQLPRSDRLILIATYHHNQIPVGTFLNFYQMLKGYQIYIDEIDYKELSVSRLKSFITDTYAKDMNELRAAPDGTLYTSCYDLVHFYNKK